MKLKKSILFAGWITFIVLVLMQSQVVLAAINFESIATASQSDKNIENVSIALPSGTVDGDLLLAYIATKKDGRTITAPTGWALINQGAREDDLSLAIFYKVASSESGPYVFNTDANAEQKAGAILRYSGVDTTTPVDTSAFAAVNSSGNTTTPTAPSVTPSYTNTMVVSAFAQKDGENVTAYPSGSTDPSGVFSRVDGKILLGIAGQLKATATATTAAQFTTNKDKKTRAATVVLVPIQVDLTIDKTTSTPIVSAGGQAEYTVTINNTGGATATSVVVADDLPSGFTFNSVTSTILGGGTTGPNPASNSGSATDPVFSSWTIPVSGSLAITYTADVAAGTVNGVYTNSATVDSAETDPVGDSVNVTVLGADVEITKSVDNPYPNEGGTIVYTLTAKNNGGGTATNVTVTDTLPADVTLVSAIPSQGSACTGTTVVSCNLGTITNGNTATVTITATVDSGLGDAFVQTNLAIISADQFDAVPGNDSATADITSCPANHILNFASVSSNQTETNTANNSDAICTRVDYSISGITWADEDGDGIQDAGEPPIPGVTVNLYDAASMLVATVQTANGTTDDLDGDGNIDPAGFYYFGPVPVGTYTVDFITPASYDETLQDQGGNDTLDSDYDPLNGEVTVVVPGGANVTDVDGGFIPLGAISGSVLNDDNENGDLDVGDTTGLTGVTLELWKDTDGNGTPDVFVSSTTTDSNGDYSFTNVPVGNYVVIETDPAGFQSVDDEDQSAEGGEVSNNSVDDNYIPVTVEFNTTDDDNDFLDVVASTNAIDDDNNTLANYPVSGDLQFNDFDLQGDSQLLTGFRIDSNGDGIPDSAGGFVTDHTDTGQTGTTVGGIDASGSPVANAGELKLETDGTYTFIPAEDFIGTVTAEYTLCDNATPQSCSTAILTITVQDWFDPLDATTNETIANDDDNVSYGDPVSDNVHNNDRDLEGDSFSVTSWQADTNGDGMLTSVPVGSTQTVYGTNTEGDTVVAGTLSLAANGAYTYTPCTDGTTPVAACDEAFYGTVSVDYENTDSPNGATDTATLTIDVLNETDEVLSTASGTINDSPFAGDDLGLSFVNEDISGNVLTNDGDPNGSLPATPVTLVTGPASGTLVLNGDGSYVYTPDTDYIGPDQFTYQICDASGACDVATVYLVMSPRMEFGDLPVILPTIGTVAMWDPNPGQTGRHYIIPGLRIGPIIDAELDRQPADDATGDDLVNTADEDGSTFATFGPDLNNNGVVDDGESASYTLGVAITNDTGRDAALVGYIDWNCNGEMEEPAERARIIVDGDGIDSGGECMEVAGVKFCGLTWGTYNGSVPLMSKASYDVCGSIGLDTVTYARLRLTTQPSFFTDSSPSPNQRARDGEIEDYVITAAATTTAAMVVDFAATSHVETGAVVSWTTASELGSVAFKVERLSSKQDKKSRKAKEKWTRVHEAKWIPSPLELQGSDYRVHDVEAVPGESYTYRIIEKTSKGKNLTYGPYKVEVSADPRELNPDPGYTVKGHFDFDHVIDNIDTREDAKAKARKAPKPGSLSLRIRVEHPGIYGLSTQELVDAFGAKSKDIDKALDKGEFKLSSGGEEIPWYAQDDMLYFYAQATDNDFSDTRTYWLDMKQKGERMPVVKVKNAGLVTETFIDHREHEHDGLFWLSLSNDPTDDIWFWTILSPFGSTFPVSLPVPGSVAVEGELRLRLWGASNADHVMNVATSAASGSVPIGKVSFSGNVAHESDPLVIPASVLGGETLELVVTLENNPSAYSSVLIDGFDVSWERAYSADAGQLEYPADGATSVYGLATNKVVTMDVMNPTAPLWIDGGKVRPAGAGYVFSAKLGPGEYVSAESVQVLKPLYMELDSTPDLFDKKNRAEYVIITNEELMEAAEALSDYRSGGLSTMVVDIQDIYDAFSYGELHPDAINAFAKASQTWKTKPRYMVILGDGSFDYRDIMGTGYNLVSPKMFGSSNGLFASDTLQGDIDGDGIPEVAFGRIPVKSNAEGLAYVAKLQNYEAGIGELPSLLLSDIPDKGGDFAFSTHLVQQQIGDDTVLIDLGNTDINSARLELEYQMDEGVRMVNYLGHGGMDRVSAHGLIVNGDESTMNNLVTPGFVGLSCLINNYSIPGWDGLGERLVVAEDGGMIVSWAATGESYNEQATLLGIKFHELLGEHQRLGDAIIATLQERPYLVPVYTLLGDPALLVQ